MAVVPSLLRWYPVPSMPVLCTVPLADQMVPVYILKRSYYCCRLRIGSIAISFLDVVFAIIGILIVGALYPGSPVIKISSLTPISPVLRTAVIIFLVGLSFTALGSIILITGVFTRWTHCLLVYLILSAIAIILCCISWAMVISSAPWYAVLVTFFFLVLSLYHWAIVYSYLIVLIAATNGTSEASDLMSEHGILQRVSL